jgi:hypothetical protein
MRTAFRLAASILTIAFFTFIMLYAMAEVGQLIEEMSLFIAFMVTWVIITLLSWLAIFIGLIQWVYEKAEKEDDDG